MEPVSIFSPKKQRSADACLFPFGHFFQLIPILSGFFCVFSTVYSSGFGICGNGCTSLMHSLPRSARFVKRAAPDSLFFTIRSFPVCIYCPLSAWLRPANCNSGCRLTQRPGKLESCLSGFLNWRFAYWRGSAHGFPYGEAVAQIGSSEPIWVTEEVVGHFSIPVRWVKCTEFRLFACFSVHSNRSRPRASSAPVCALGHLPHRGRQGAVRQTPIYLAGY